MRISDWSSDVCSSDLSASPSAAIAGIAAGRQSNNINKNDCRYRISVLLLEEHAQCVCIVGLHDRDQFPTLCAELVELGLRALGELAAEQLVGQFHHLVLPAFRSEEHTSELQSLMRISYAVFCLKKKTNT